MQYSTFWIEFSVSVEMDTHINLTRRETENLWCLFNVDFTHYSIFWIEFSGLVERETHTVCYLPRQVLFDLSWIAILWCVRTPYLVPCTDRYNWCKSITVVWTIRPFKAFSLLIFFQSLGVNQQEMKHKKDKA